ncbi:MAG: gfo/Idh/MocA family oxidoreductase [Candidatus Latescibacteria bacterium]|nr:gfo/Idh/MocA family oxidoreductase [Candidatus Latescibacterota bacterium]
MLRVGLIGAGHVGTKRATVIGRDHDTRLTLVHDRDPAAAQTLAQAHGADTRTDWRAVVEDQSVDIVIVATFHDALATISSAALQAGKHVLCEKPVGRNPVEVRAVAAAVAASGRCFKAGYNHRYHPALVKVRHLYNQGHLGPLTFIRGRYGHGGRPGYESEWRGQADRAGGGELLDQGAHLIDLALWFFDDFAAVTGFVATQVWDMAPLEDNAFGLFRTDAEQIASLHVSWTQWKNLFSFEVFGRDGYASVEGLGGSYGPEQAVWGRRSPGGPPQLEHFAFPEEDFSWNAEWTDFTRAIAGEGPALDDASRAVRTMEWIYRLYRASEENRAVFAKEAPT